MERSQKRLKELERIFEGVAEEKRILIAPMLAQVVNLEERLEYLKTLPQIQVDKKNPAKQRATPASKQYKEAMQSYSLCIKTLLGVFYREKSNGADELVKMLKEFEL